MTIVLHYLTESRARRILWILEELQLPFDVKVYHRNSASRAPKELEQIHPSGKSPVIVDGNLVIAESGLIIQYLVETYGKNSELYPRNEADKLQIDYGLFAAEGNYMVSLMSLYINHMAREKMPFGVRQVIGKVLTIIESYYAQPELELCLKNMANALEKNGGYFVGGRLTGSDIMYESPTRLLERIQPDTLKKYPAVVKWLETVSSRPAYIKAHEKEIELDNSPKL